MTDCSGLVTWFQPVAQVDGVTVSYGPSSHPTERTSVDLSTSDKQYSIDSLSPDTEYQVSLISRRGDTTSEPVSEIFTTGRGMIISNPDKCTPDKCKLCSIKQYFYSPNSIPLPSPFF